MYQFYLENIMSIPQPGHGTNVHKIYLHFYKPYNKLNYQDDRQTCTDLTLQMMMMMLSQLRRVTNI